MKFSGNVSIIGLGKLGASMAAAIAGRGMNVIGVDVSEDAVAKLNSGHAPVQETDLETTIAKNKERIRATMSHEEAVMESDISFVIVPTPSDDRGAFSLQYAAWAFREIGKALAKKDSYHNVVLTSTVLPGATQYGLLPVLEQESGKKCGQDFGLCYSPEFIALGSVIRDFLHPDFTLVGEYDEKCGAILEQYYAKIMPDQPPCMRMSLENAELTKISVNAFVTTKITFANMLSSLCERIPGGNVDVVTKALGLDKRIGAKYLTGGLGYGGPCFPRDNVALGFIARALGMPAELAETTDRVNRQLPLQLIEKIQEIVPKGATVAVLGLAYKPCSHVIEESQGITIVKALSKSGSRVIAYDPLAGPSAKMELAYAAVVLDSIDDCLKQAEYIVVANADPLFKNIDTSILKKNTTVIDCWRFLEAEIGNKPGIRYLPVGRCLGSETSSILMKKLWRQK